MPHANELLPFATGAGANVLDQASWAGLPGRTAGFASGVAQSQQLNKAWRQSSFAATMIGKFTADYGIADVLDDGNVQAFEDNFKAALQAAVGTAAAILPWAVDAGLSANSLAFALVPAPTAGWATPLEWFGVVGHTNTLSTVTVAITGLTGTKNVVKADGSALSGGDLVAGKVYIFGYDGSAVRVVQALPSDFQAQFNAQKVPFNQSQLSWATRQVLTGTGFVTYQTGSYTKKSATSKLVIRATTNLFALGNAAGTMKLDLGGGNIVQAVCANSDGSLNKTAANVEKTFSGLAATTYNWTLYIGRNDGVSWTSTINPNSTDQGSLPSETTTSLVFNEIEP